MEQNTSIYGQQTLAFVERLDAAVTFGELCEEIRIALEWFGFTCVTSFMMPAPGENFDRGIVLNTRPPEYTDHYVSNDYVARDPVLTELRLTTHPYSWSDIRKRRSLSKAEATIVDEAQEFGINDGLIIPIVTLSGSMSVFSPCGPAPNLSPVGRRSVELIALFAHQALKRKILADKRKESMHRPLTEREREVMRWVAAGKSDDEIAQILSISSRTVGVHVENAKRKLDAFRRTFAVVQAIRTGEITI